MKKKILLTITMIFISLFALGLTASAATYGNLIYEAKNGEVTITDCNIYVTSVTIPATINGYPVTSIGYGAFYGCKSLTSIDLPDSLTTIGNRAFDNTGYYNNAENWEDNVLYLGNHLIDAKTSISGAYTVKAGTKTIADYAFSNCNSLTSIDLPDNLTNIGDYAFYWCESLTSIDLPDNLTSIGDYTIYNCSSLTSIDLPDSVTSIGDCAFYCCKSLTSIDLPNGVTTIGDYAFYGCRSLTNIDLPDSLTTIGNKAFENCSSLTSIDLPDSLTSIGNYAFHWCKSLTSIDLPDSVTSIGDGVFYFCGSLVSIDVEENNPNYSSENGVLFDKEKKTIITYPCKKNDTSYVISDSVTSIGGSAFYGCSSLTSIVLPDGVTTIGDYAFYGCSSLTSINLPDGVTTIGDYAFYGCSSLTSINLPDGVTTIGDFAFYGCESLTSINLPDDVTAIGGRAFYGCSSLTSIDLPDSLTTIGNRAFSRCESLTSIVLPYSLTSIDNFAFEYCSSLTSIDLPDSVTSIGISVFSRCESLTSIDVDKNNPNYSSQNGVLFDKDKKTIIAYPCGKSNTSYAIPDSVTSIGNYAFSFCSSLTSINLPDGVTSISDEAFYGCRSLKTVYYYGTEEDWNEINIGDGNEPLTQNVIFIPAYTQTELLDKTPQYDIYSVTPVNVSVGNTIIFASYAGNKMICVESREYTGKKIEYFVEKNNYNKIKVFVWEGLENLKPITIAEIIQ